MTRTHTSERGGALGRLRSSSWLLLALLLLAPLRGLAQDATPAPATPAPTTPAPTTPAPAGPIPPTSVPSNPAPPTPAPTTPTKPLLWTVAPTRAQLQAEVDALAAELAAAELPSTHGAFRRLNRARSRLPGITGAPTVESAARVRLELIRSRYHLQRALIFAASTRDDLLARITAMQAGVAEMNRQLQGMRSEFERKYPLPANRTFRDAEREFEPTARKLDLYGLNSPERRVAAAVFRAEFLTFEIHRAVQETDSLLSRASSLLTDARSTLLSASDPLPGATLGAVRSQLLLANDLSLGRTWLPIITVDRGYLTHAVVGALVIDREKEAEEMARAQIGKIAASPDTSFPRRRVIAEMLPAAIAEIERLEREHATLAAMTQNNAYKKTLDFAARILEFARKDRWLVRMHHDLFLPSIGWRGIWDSKGVRYIETGESNPFSSKFYYVHLLFQNVRFSLRQTAVFSTAALQREFDTASQRIDGLAELIRVSQSQLDSVVAGRGFPFSNARTRLANARSLFDRARGDLDRARAQLAKAKGAAAGSAEFVAAGHGLLSYLRIVFDSAPHIITNLRSFWFSLDSVRGSDVSLPAPPASRAAWIELTTHVEHGKEIEVMAREVWHDRVYARTRALFELRALPAAAAARFTAAEQHVAVARRELAGVRGVAAADPLPRAAADAIQGELEAARADVAAGLAVLDREVPSNVSVLRGRLRDATAALDAAEAQIGRAETHLAANLPLPTGVSFAASLNGLEAAWREVDLYGLSPHREVRRYNREEQVEIHRAHNRIARARREYLAAARAHLAKVKKALTPAPAALTPTLLAAVTGDLLGAEADRRALREEILGARRGEDRIRQHIRPKRAMALRRQPAVEPPKGTPEPSRQVWRDRLAPLGGDLVKAELAVEAALVARPPALQTAGDTRAASLLRAERGLVLGREQLFFRTRHVLQGLGAVVPGWPRAVAEGFAAAHSAVRTAQNQLDLARDVPETELTAWRDRSAADVTAAERELAALRTALGDKTLPAVDTLIADASRKITARSTRQKTARDELNRAIAAGTKLSGADRRRFLGEFAFASTLEVVLQPLIGGGRIVAAAMQPAPVGTPPAAPTGVTANGMAPYVMVGWSVRTGESYSVYRCITAAPASCGGARATGLTTSPYLDLTAPLGQSYSYRVRAHVGRRQSALSAAAVSARPAPATAVVTVLLTAAGDGTNGVSAVGDVAVDGRGVVYAVAQGANNVFRIGVDGAVTRILGGRGVRVVGGSSNIRIPVRKTHMADPQAVAVSPAGVIYVAGGAGDNVFRLIVDDSSYIQFTPILFARGDGTNTLDFAADVVVEASGAVVVAGRDSDNVFRVAADGTITQIASSTGDGTNALDEPVAVAAAPDGGVYVAGRASNNVFRVAADGTITQVASATGDGTDALRAPTALAVDAAGNALVVGSGSGTVFRVTPKGAVTRIYKATAESSPRLQTLRGIAVDGAGEIYVTAHGSDDIAVLASDGTARQILGGAGVGTTRLDGPTSLAADAAGNLYVASSLSHAVFRISTRVHGVLASTDAGSFALREPAALALAGDGRLYVADRQGSGRMFTITRGGVLETSFPLAAAAPSWVSAPRPSGLALDAAQQFYVTGRSSDNAVAGALWNTGALRELVAAAGDGSNPLRGPTSLVVGAAGTVYVAGGTSDNVFRVTKTTAGAVTVTQLLGSAGDGTNRLDSPSALALHSDGTLYVAGRDSDNVFRVTAAGVVSQLLGPAGVGDHALDGPVALALNTAGDLFIASAENDNVFRVPVKGTATRVASAAGDGVNALDRPVSLAVDAGGELYVAGGDSHNLLRVSPGGAVVQWIGASGDGRTRFHSPLAVVAQERGVVAVATAGRTGSAAIPAAVFRIEAQPAAVAPPSPRTAGGLPLLWTVAPTRPQLQGEIDAVAAALTAAEATPRFRAALEAESGSLYTKIAAARTQLATARTRLAAITGAPTVANAAGVRQGLIESGAARARAQNEAADTTEEALTARIAALQTELDEVLRQIRNARGHFDGRFPRDADRTLGDAEREFEPTARELDLFGLSSARRKAAGARHRAERLTFVIHRAVDGSQAALSAARSALAAARAAVAAAPTPIPAATVSEIVAALDRAALGSRATAVVSAGLLDDPGSLFRALMAAAEVDRQEQLAVQEEAKARATATPEQGAVPPRRSAIAEDVAVAFFEQERLAGELAALPTTTDTKVRRFVHYAEDRLAHAREQRWRRRSEFSFATSTWSGLWEPGEVAPLQAIAGASYGESLLRAGAWIREAGFALRQSTVFTAAALADEVERMARRVAGAAGLLAAARSETAGLTVATERAADLTAARAALTAAEADLAAARSQLVVARAELAKAQGATAGSAEFVRAGGALLSATGAAMASVSSALLSDFAVYQRSLYAARGMPADPAALAAFTAAWIEGITQAEHGGEIDVVARELRDARVYATTRALLGGGALPAAVRARLAAAEQHIAGARSRLAALSRTPAADPIPPLSADGLQRELEEARSDVAEALAELDRRVAPNVFALRGRLRDAAAALDAAEAQIDRGMSFLELNLALPVGVSFADSLRGLEAVRQEVDLYGSVPARGVRLATREIQVESHRARRRVQRSRREYLAAARAHLARVASALETAPVWLGEALVAQLTWELVGGAADRRQLREQHIAARGLEFRVRREVRPRLVTARREALRDPQQTQAVLVPAGRERWAKRLAALGSDLVELELGLDAGLGETPPALQPRGDARAASLTAAEGSFARVSGPRLRQVRSALAALGGTVPRWPSALGAVYGRLHWGVREAMSHLERALGIPWQSLTRWLDRATADLELAEVERGALLRELASLAPLPPGRSRQQVEGALKAVETRIEEEGETAALVQERDGLRGLVQRFEAREEAERALREITVRNGRLAQARRALDEGGALTEAEQKRIEEACAREAVRLSGGRTRVQRERILDDLLAAGSLADLLAPVLRSFQVATAAAAAPTVAALPAPTPLPEGATPAVPTEVAASVGTSAAHVAVSWSVRGGEIYSVYRCVTTAEASCGTARGNRLTASPYLDSAVPAGQPFQYRVRAHIGTEQSALSAAAVGERRAPAAQVVTALLTAVGDGRYGASLVRDVAMDGSGVVYAVAQGTNNVFRIAPDGAVSQLLGMSGAGSYHLKTPQAVAVTRAGVVFVAGGGSDNVLRVAADGTVTQVLGPRGDGRNALDFPADVALEADGAVLVAGRDSDNVFRIAADGTVTQILSATGDGTNALDGPSAVAVAADGGVYVAGQASNNVFRIAADGTVTQVASSTGDGKATLFRPIGLAVVGNDAVVAGAQSNTVFRVTPAGTVTLLYRDAGRSPRLVAPQGVAVDGLGQIYVSGQQSDNVVVIPTVGDPREIATAVGDGATRLDDPLGLVVDAAGNVVVASAGSHAALRISTRVHSVLAATDAGSVVMREPAALALAGDGRLYVADRGGKGRLFTVTRDGVFEGSQLLSALAPSTVSAPRPSGVALDGSQTFYVAGQTSDNAVAGTIWTRTALREVITAAGDGTLALSGPTTVVASAAGTVYVAGGTSDNVFRVTTTTAGAVTVSQLIGSGGDGTNALDGPSALALHSDGTLYVAGRDSDNVFRVTAAGVVSQVLARAGVGGHALDGPVALALNAAGDLFVASAENDNVFRVPATATGTATRVASAVGDGTHTLDRPVSLAVDAEGELYVAGGDSHNLLRVSPGGAVVQVIGANGDGRVGFHSPVAVVAQGRGAVSVATAGRTGTSPIPASVFRLEPRPAPAPPPAAPEPAPSP